MKFSMKTITKFRPFVIVACLAAAAVSGCSIAEHLAGVRATPDPAFLSDDFGKAEVIGTIDSPIVDESSGLASSKCQDGILWTHNDSGNEPRIFALDLEGEIVGVWDVREAENRDWEDIASTKEEGKCYLYVGDIGDNDLARDSVTVYRIEEPVVTGAAFPRKKSEIPETKEAEEIEIRYPNGSRNAEALLVHPESLDIYIVTKVRGTSAEVYRIAASAWRNSETGKPLASETVATISMPTVLGGFLTGGDISPDGRRVVLSDYISAYELALPKGEDDFSSIWERTPAVIDTGHREQGESVAYSADGRAIFLTSEKAPVPLIEIKRK